MNYHDCDQLGEDLQWAMDEMWNRFGVSVTLHITTLEQIMERVNVHYPVDEFEELLEHVLDTHERIEPFMNDMQRKGYKKCLGKVYWRRSEEARQKTRAFLEAHGFT